jgi:hypothetical protein
MSKFLLTDIINSNMSKCRNSNSNKPEVTGEERRGERALGRAV